MSESPNMNSDPFSDLIQLMTARTVASGGLVAGGTWALEIPPPNGIKFWGVARGGCWVKLEGVSNPLRLEGGDVLLLTAPRSLVMGSDLSTPRTELDDLLSKRDGAISHLGEGDDFFMIGGNVALAHAGSDLILDALPPYLHLDAKSPVASTLQWLLDQLVRERQEDRPGAIAVASQLAQLMFIQILRTHLETTPSVAGGVLRAACDRRLVPALRLIHSDTARAWQLSELAASSAMSRAAFCAYFKQVAGIAPITYLTMWRMRLAKRALVEERVQVSEMAPRFGYASESAFSNAFKRVTGLSPKHYRESATL
ncbi:MULTISPECIES: AraC family transcriptional regulator [unclassified Pseudomonas]|uniref:AraC family transcriptional regulator n=1 Tax=unclassified Pseudomonas TaxID=196821 RepID=UPI00384D3E0D